MKSKVVLLILLFSIFQVKPVINQLILSQNIQNSLIKQDLCNDLNKVSFALIGLLCGYKLSEKIHGIIKTYLNAKIDDEIVNKIILAVTTNLSISFLSEEQKENKFKEKAKLINMRKRIINALELRIDNNLDISTNHKENIRQALNKAKRFFDLVDEFRKIKICGINICYQNSYENLYKEPDIQEKYIESKIINSIIQSFKPDNECNQLELKLKKEAEIRKEKIMARVRGKISDIWFNRLAPLMFLFLHIR